MPKAKPDTLKGLTQTQAAALIGKSSKWLRDRADLFATTRDTAGKYNAPELVAAFVAHNCKEAERKAAKSPRSADTSPELERWRKARADMAEMELAHRAGKLAPLDMIVEFHNREGDLWRKARERTELMLDGDLLARFRELWDDHHDDLLRVAREYLGEQPKATEPCN